MTASKIDWTKPLRVVGTHERVYHVAISVGGGDVSICAYYREDDAERTALINADGSAKKCRSDPLGQRGVENIPPEPRIVERWTVVDCPASDVYLPITVGFFQQRKHAEKERDCLERPDRLRLAKLLIEEAP